MSLKDQITEDMKTAMRAKDMERLGTIRLLQAAMKQKEVDERITLDDAGVIAIVDKLIKQRKDSIAAFEGAGRQDLADKEKAEMAVLQVYLPARLSAEEVAAEVKAIVTEREVNDLKYWDLVECGQTLSSEVLSWLVVWALREEGNLQYRINGGPHKIGQQEFLEADT